MEDDSQRYGARLPWPLPDGETRTTSTHIQLLCSLVRVCSQLPLSRRFVALVLQGAEGVVESPLHLQRRLLRALLPNFHLQLPLIAEAVLFRNGCCPQ